MQVFLAFWVILKRNKYSTSINCVTPKQNLELKEPKVTLQIFTKCHCLQRW